jgi:hypothetical protein
MWFSSWLRKKQHSPVPRRQRTFRPRLEVLEGRCLPSILTVTNTKDNGPNSLRGDIAAAHSGDTIVFSPKLAGQTITLTSGELLISKNLAILGPAPGQGLIKVSVGYGDSRVFEVGPNAVVTMSGLWITNGHAIFNPTPFDPSDGLGGGIKNEGTLTVSDCWLTGNVADHDGGGIYNAGTLTVSNSTLEGNGVGVPDGWGLYYGGGIYNAGLASALTVLNSNFSSNLPDSIYGPYTDGGGNSFN